MTDKNLQELKNPMGGNKPDHDDKQLQKAADFQHRMHITHHKFGLKAAEGGVEHATKYLKDSKRPEDHETQGNTIQHHMARVHQQHHDATVRHLAASKERVAHHKAALGEETIDELNRDTLNSYAKKSDADYEKRSAQASKDIKSGEVQAKGSPALVNAHKLDKRLEGGSRAHDRLHKEEVEQIEELSNDKLTAYKKAAQSQPLAKEGDKTAGSILKTARKRQAGVKVATKKLGEEMIDEGMIDKIKGLVGKSKAQKASKAFAQRKLDKEKLAKGNPSWDHVEHKRGTKVREELELDENEVKIPAHDELEGQLPTAPSKAAHLSLATKGQLKMLATAAKSKYVSHTNVEVPGVTVKEEAEELDEVSAGTLKSYVKKSTADSGRMQTDLKGHEKDVSDNSKTRTAKVHAHMGGEAGEDHTGDGLRRGIANRQYGVIQAKKRLKEEAVIRKGDAVPNGGTDLVPPSIPTKKNPSPFGNGAAKPSAPEGMKSVQKEEVVDESTASSVLRHIHKASVPFHDRDGSGMRKANTAARKDHGSDAAAHIRQTAKGSTHGLGDERNEFKAGIKSAVAASKARKTNEETEGLDEISGEMQQRYYDKAKVDVRAKEKKMKAWTNAGGTAKKKDVDKIRNRRNTMDHVAQNTIREEQIDELSNDTKRSYITKASGDIAKHARIDGIAIAKGDYKNKAGDKSTKRLIGIAKAVHKIREEITMISFKDYLKLEEEFDFEYESEELSEEFISHSDFQDKLANHKRNGAVVHHDYDHKAKKAIIRHVDSEGEVREFHYHDKGTTVNRLAPKHRGASGTEAKPAEEKRKRGRQAGSKHTYKPRAPK